jgi:Dolichyl-phosphate-mannose-protein mannosyltransferase
MVERTSSFPARRALPLRAESVRRAWFELGVCGCTAAVLAFLLVQLTAWPPHEDETLALFVGRQSFGHLLRTVLGERGGAPLHFVLAWVVAHTGGGLASLRLISALFATASVPVMALLGRRLAGPAAALVGTALASASWVLLFHGIYGRMYSLFLFTSALSYLALVHAVDRGGRRAWVLWGAAVLVCVASHPYGALVLGSQAVYVLLRRRRSREAVVAVVAVAVLGIPFWRTDVVLAGRFDVGVGGGGAKLGTPGAVLDYLWNAAGDYSAGYRATLIPILLLGLVGLVQLARTRFWSALLAAGVIATPAVALMTARLGSATSPESRHLIFTLPFFSLLVGAGLVRVASLVPRASVAVALLAVLAFAPAEIAWGWQKTPQLYTGEPGVRIEARSEAAAWLAKTSRPDDVLFGYEPLYMQAWERAGNRVSQLVVPRADSKLALETLLDARKPLGHGVWIFDASDTTNWDRRLQIRFELPDPARLFEARAYGPFLVIRTREPTLTVRNYLKLARRVEFVGVEQQIGDGFTNIYTVADAARRLALYERGRTAASDVSR